MKTSIQSSISNINTRYGWIINSAVKNMRLLLLLLFAGLSTYLVVRINSLVSSESNLEATISSSKKLDADVLSTFNELSVQQVQLDSNFDENRQNPF
jgi:hypothetical protein